MTVFKHTMGGHASPHCCFVAKLVGIMLCYGTQDDRFEQLHILAIFLVLAIVGSRCLDCSFLVLLPSAGASI
jgi:hypothetical protein